MKVKKIFIFFLVVIVIIAVTLILNPKENIYKLLMWIQGLGIFGPVFLAIFYIFACILFIPGSILTLAAGFMFGIIVGTITVSIGSTIGACAAFLVGRTLARKWIERKISGNKTFQAIDDAVEKEGFKIVFLTRLSPVFPFNLINYAFGLTKVKFYTYAIGSWIGMLPGTILYVYFGSAVKNFTDIISGNIQVGISKKIFFVIGLIATVLITVVITRIARKTLNQSVFLKNKK